MSGQPPSVRRDLEPRTATLLVGAAAMTYVVTFLLSAWSGSTLAWTVLSAFFSDIARDLLGAGGSPWDGFDGLVVGPLLWGMIEAPLLAALGPVGFVHVLATLLVGLGGLVATAAWLRQHSRLAAVLGAWLVALPAPNQLVHAHAGAYHVFAILLLPLALGLLGAPGGGRRRAAAGALVLGLLSSTQLGNGPLAAGILAFWCWAGGRRDRLGVALVAGAAFAAGLLPLLWKARVHVPFDGLVPATGPGVSAAVKPLLLRVPDPLAMPERLAGMLFREGPYGLHWEIAGLPGFGHLHWWLGLGALALAARTRPAAALPLAGGVIGQIAAGLVTGWFVFFVDGEVPFSRDGRHIMAVVHLLGVAIAIAAADLLSNPARSIRWLTGLALAALLGAGGATVAQSIDVDGLAAARWETPFRLGSRYVTGYFRSRYFLEAPATAARSCAVLPDLQGADCLRGVAFGFGSAAAWAAASASPGTVDASALCQGLAGHGPSATARELDEACGFGLGWGLSDHFFRRPAVAIERCDRASSFSDDARRSCVEGVAWGIVQNFADRPQAMRQWWSEVPEKHHVSLASGVGIWLGMVSTDGRWIDGRCRRDFDDEVPACLDAAARQARWMGPIRWDR